MHCSYLSRTSVDCHQPRKTSLSPVICDHDERDVLGRFPQQTNSVVSTVLWSGTACMVESLPCVLKALCIYKALRFGQVCRRQRVKCIIVVWWV
jgi:hypothetical protein